VLGTQAALQVCPRRRGNPNAPAEGNPSAGGGGGSGFGD